MAAGEYDIVYSVTAHECPPTIINLVDNIFKFNKNNRALVILHLNDAMHAHFTAAEADGHAVVGLNNHSVIGVDNHAAGSVVGLNNHSVIINPSHFNKGTFTRYILMGHLSNYRYLRDRDVIFHNIMLLASNCMFIRQAPHYPYRVVTYGEHHATTWPDHVLEHWRGDWEDPIKRNLAILKVLETNRIKMCKELHEGSIYTNDCFGMITAFCDNWGLMEKVTEETKFEEFLPPTLEFFYTGQIAPRVCTIYWHRPGYVPSTDDIMAQRERDGERYIVKRIPRVIDNPIRAFINGLPE